MVHKHSCRCALVGITESKIETERDLLGYWRKRSVVGTVGGVLTPLCIEIVGCWWLSRVSSAGIAFRCMELLVLGATNVYECSVVCGGGESPKSSSSSRVLCEISWGPHCHGRSHLPLPSSASQVFTPPQLLLRHRNIPSTTFRVESPSLSVVPVFTAYNDLQRECILWRKTCSLSKEQLICHHLRWNEWWVEQVWVNGWG